MSAQKKAGAVPESNANLRVLQDDFGRTSIAKAAFLKSFERADKTLGKKLDRCLENPDETGVHDARTAIRKLEAHIRLLPKKTRNSPEAKEALKRLDKAMKGSAEVRDLDVIKERISRYSGDARELLLKRIDDKRQKSAKEARVAMASARKVSFPAWILNDLTQTKLQKRFQKVVGKLVQSIDDLTPVVASDPRRLDELHKLRIDCKKLRYALEPALAEESPALAMLKKWQDALGSIHDWDITTSFVRAKSQTTSELLLRQATEERETEFLAFSRSVLQPRRTEDVSQRVREPIRDERQSSYHR